MFRVLFLVFLFIRLGSAAAPFPDSAAAPFPGSTDVPTCFTHEKIQQITTICIQLFKELNTTGLTTVDTNTMNVTIPDENLPPLLDFLCNTTEYRLLNSWSLKDKWREQIFGDRRLIISPIANIGNICGTSLGGIIESIAGAPNECKHALEAQAGFPNPRNKTFSDLLDIVETCNNSVNVTSDWACMTSIAASRTFKKCIAGVHRAVGRAGHQAMCGQYECVFTEMQVCGETAIDLYIKAVNMEKYKINLEMGFGIKESYDGCGGASDLCYSVLALTVGCFLSMLNN